MGAGAAGLAAVQAFRSQLPQDAAEYVRLNVLPRPGPQPPRAWAEPLITWGAWQKGPLPWRPLRARLLERWSWRGGNGGAGRGHCGRRSLRAGPRHGLGAGEHALPAPAGQRGRGRAGRPVRQRYERRHAAAALHAALRQQHFRQPRKKPRLLAVWIPCSGAGQSHAAPLLLGPQPSDSASVPAELPRKLPQLRTPEPPASAEL